MTRQAFRALRRTRVALGLAAAQAAQSLGLAAAAQQLAADALIEAEREDDDERDEDGGSRCGSWCGGCGRCG